MQETEKFYNALWRSKNARQSKQDDELVYETSGKLRVQRETTSRQQQKILLSIVSPRLEIGD